MERNPPIPDAPGAKGRTGGGFHYVMRTVRMLVHVIARSPVPFDNLRAGLSKGRRSNPAGTLRHDDRCAQKCAKNHTIESSQIGLDQAIVPVATPVQYAEMVVIGIEKDEEVVRQ